MGKFSGDYSGVDTSRGVYAGEQPKAGPMYPAKLVICEEHTAASSGKDGTHWVFEITDGPYEGWRGHVYTNSDSAAWKESQILVAIGALKDPKGKIQTTHEKLVAKAGPVKIKTKTEVYEGEDRARITIVAAANSEGNNTPSKEVDPDDPFGEDVGSEDSSEDDTF